MDKGLNYGWPIEMQQLVGITVRDCDAGLDGQTPASLLASPSKQTVAKRQKKKIDWSLWIDMGGKMWESVLRGSAR